MQNKYSQQAQKASARTQFKSNYGELADVYSSAVNAPGKIDALASDFNNMADAYSTQGPANQTSKAVLGGFGAGLQGYANEQRRTKLSPIEQQVHQLLELDAGLKAHMYEDQSEKMKTMKFFKQNAVPIAELSKASLAGDSVAANEIARSILENYKEAFDDPSMGEFISYKDGDITFKDLEKGGKRSYNIAQLIYQNEIEPVELYGQDAPMIVAGLSPGAKMNYENSMQAQQYQMQNMDLQNQKIRSDIGVNNQKINTTPATPYNKDLAQHNLAYIKEARGQAKTDEILAQTLDEFEKVIIAAQKDGSAGTSLTAELKRKYQSFAGNNKNATLATMLQGAYFHKIKEAGGSNPSGSEFERVLATLPGIDKNPAASLAVIRQDREYALKNVDRYKKTEAFLRKNNYQGSPDDPSIFEGSDNTSKVIMEAPDGSRRSVNAADVEALIARGAKVIQ